MLSLLLVDQNCGVCLPRIAVSRAGDAFNSVALVVLVYRLTGSGLGVAATVAFEVAPVLLLGPVAALVADRYPRRTVMVTADVFRAALAALLAIYANNVAAAYAVSFWAFRRSDGVQSRGVVGHTGGGGRRRTGRR